ncbi:expressed unknown protein [Seminavis robusta]|uniref:Uncharacterized protein n=1 Tax=Seminavis robusta TaxID=568900 RepID=A0A9N8DAK7_9STRA|nr:expressed unknown protein [Seminavis robusta]|eukprot:Sro66_g037161.1  (219) ;mRNA; f:61377-62033
MVTSQEIQQLGGVNQKRAEVEWAVSDLQRDKEDRDAEASGKMFKPAALAGALFFSVRSHQNPTTIQEDPSWDTLKQAQDAIGWHHLLKGRISKQFSQEQDRYLNMKKTATKRNNGLTWLTGLIDIIYKEWWKLWDMRNQDRHGHDMRTKSQAKKAQAIRQLTQFYEAYQQEVPEHLEWLFQIPLESRMQLNTPVIIQFLNTWEPVLQESHYTTALETG